MIVISNEEWRTVVVNGEVYENYMVSNWGNFKSLNYRNSGKEKILSPYKDTNNYLTVAICREGKMKLCKLHRIVAETFLENTENLPCVDHIDTINIDNRVENLRWCTPKENSNNDLTRKHIAEARKGKTCSEETKKRISKANKGKTRSEEAKKKIGKAKKGKTLSEEHKKKISESLTGKIFSEKTKNRISEAKYKKVLCIETGEIFPSVKEASRQLGISNSSISMCCRGKRKSAGGYHWKYL